MQHVNTPKFKFIPLKFAWTAIHPQSKGTIYFVGGAFFGTFPTLFYRFFLRQLYLQGYTIVALPFRFSLRHWSVALSLLASQRAIRESLQCETRRMGWPTTIPAPASEHEPGNQHEYWIGHSLGCKYIALLELLTDYEIFEGQDDLLYCLGEKQAQRIDQLIDKTELATVSLYNQPSILLDPVISDLDNAVPLKSLRLFLNRFIQVLPSRQETFCLISQSHLFALTSIVAFQSQLAQESVAQLQARLGDRLWGYQTLSVPRNWLGKHSAALGWKRGNRDLVKLVGDILSKHQQS